jgi:hypothetical protein
MSLFSLRGVIALGGFGALTYAFVAEKMAAEVYVPLTAAIVMGALGLGKSQDTPAKT